jgi:nitrogen fixation protein FixH
MTEPQRSNGARSKKVLTGRGVLAWFLSFFFVVIGANLFLVYFAVTTFSGVSTDDAYRKGRDYNEILRQAESQKALDWTLDVSYLRTEAGDIRLNVSAIDRLESPIEDLQINATFWRPTAQGIDQTQLLTAAGEGHYVGVFDLPVDGNWQIRIEASDADGNRFRKTEQAFIKP